MGLICKENKTKIQSTQWIGVSIGIKFSRCIGHSQWGSRRCVITNNQSTNNTSYRDNTVWYDNLKLIVLLKLYLVSGETALLCPFSWGDCQYYNVRCECDGFERLQEPTGVSVWGMRCCHKNKDHPACTGTIYTQPYYGCFFFIRMDAWTSKEWCSIYLLMRKLGMHAMLWCDDADHKQRNRGGHCFSPHQSGYKGKVKKCSSKDHVWNRINR